MIQPGDRYVEGELDPYRAGGFGHDRMCFACAGLTNPQESQP